MKTLGNRVKSIRQHIGMSQEQLAQLCDTTQQTIQHLEADRVKKPSYLINLGDALGVDPRWLMHGYFDLEPDLKTLSSSAPPTGSHNTSMNSQPDMVPVYGGSMELDGGDIARLDNEHIVEYATKHTSQGTAKTAFKLYVLDDTMEPRYFPNEVVAVHPGKMPSTGDDCVIEFTDGRLLVRRFLKKKKDRICVTQYTPKKSTEFKNADIRGVYAIVGRD